MFFSVKIKDLTRKYLSSCPPKNNDNLPQHSWKVLQVRVSKYKVVAHGVSDKKYKTRNLRNNYEAHDSLLHF